VLSAVIEWLGGGGGGGGGRMSAVSYSVRMSGDSVNVELHLLRLTECEGDFRI
jgi:hypothetical protein